MRKGKSLEIMEKLKEVSPERGTFPQSKVHTAAVSFTLSELAYLLDALERSGRVFGRKDDPRVVLVGRMRSKVMVAYCDLFLNSDSAEDM